MANPHFTFEQALPYIRRGFIMRAHGGDEWQGIEVREEKGVLEYSRGDGQWQPAASVPLMDLAYDTYDQKRQPDDDAAKLQRAEPLVAFQEGEDVRLIDGNELVRVDAVLGNKRVRIKRADGNIDFVHADQLKADEEYSFGGGNSPQQIDASSNAAAVSTPGQAAKDGSGFGINAGQVEQAKHGGIEYTDEHRVEADAEQGHSPVEPDGIPEDASTMVESGEHNDEEKEPAGADNESDGGVDPDQGGKRKKKGRMW